MAEGRHTPLKADVVVFDLDDTLYEEMSFVRGGFRAVAAWLEREVSGARAERCYEWMLEELERQGRGRVFDAVLERLGRRASRRMVAACVQVYRRHEPVLALYPDAERVLRTLDEAGVPAYIVTDGHPGVQAAKLKALGLAGRPPIRRCYLTRRYGLCHEKPSPHCFRLICEREGVSPGRVVYVGDNPRKDFVGIRPLGFRTVRVMRGAHASVELDETHEAEARVRDLEEFMDWLTGGI